MASINESMNKGTEENQNGQLSMNNLTASEHMTDDCGFKE
ncbi:uncharacterized protein G2W53_024768 [Senna tora]|uniref:Uncharacterized protein n=1 Tax=Senna tora TaxID=362788 RepID=A0A834TBU3_9FABA|nr:uncharacterized protein G2W53_024768 [Senna tora]